MSETKCGVCCRMLSSTGTRDYRCTLPAGHDGWHREEVLGGVAYYSWPGVFR